jgi:hypothetical protein
MPLIAAMTKRDRMKYQAPPEDLLETVENASGWTSKISMSPISEYSPCIYDSKIINSSYFND